MFALPNLDLFAVGIMVAATFVLGFAVYFNNKSNATHKTYLALCLATSFWGVLNYSAYHFTEQQPTILIIRLVLFSATLHSAAIYLFSLTFPSEKFTISKSNKYIVFPVVGLCLILTLTPLVFRDFISGGVVSSSFQMLKGPLWLFFPAVIMFLVSMGLFNLIKKIYVIEKNKRGLIGGMLFGFFVTFLLIVTFNLIYPFLLSDTRFVPYAPIFTFPFILCTAYGIFKHKFFDIKVTDAILLSILILILGFGGIVISKDFAEITYRGIVFIVLLASVLVLLKIVIREIQLKKEIQRLVKQLREADEMKAELISLATHHISNPLTAINGYISLLKEDKNTNLSSESRGYVSSLEKVTVNLVTIVRDFLDVNRIDRGKVVYSFSPADLNAIIQTALREVDSTFTSRSIAVSFRSNVSHEPNVVADFDKLKQAFKNILENCARFLTGGHIDISVLPLNGKIEVIIIDNATRNVPVMSATLARKFTETGDEDEAKIIAQGLGLYVAKEIIKAHKGTLRIKKNSENDGLTFQMII